MFKRTIISLLAIAGLVVGSLGAVYFNSPATDALSMKNFDAGNIISDAVFYDSNSMTASQIQNFLDNKVPVCDTNGSKPYLWTGKTVKEYWTPRGEPAPYTCLKDWEQKTPSVHGESGICSYMKGYSSRTAAQIISDVGKACGISPKVLLVLLQKEQSLVTDTSPLRNLQYGSATGMGCPDTAGCDPAYDGFFNQVYGAARQYKLYRAAPSNYNHVAGQNNYVRYSPNEACGGSIVYIQNQATAGLYNYTPYQPNEATKNVPYGHTADCGAYGNKNFWYLFTSWFGSTQSIFKPMQTPRFMQVKQDTQKLDLTTGEPTGSLLREGQEIYFSTKTTVGGDMVLRTRHDTNTNRYLGVYYKDLESIEVTYVESNYPRWMKITEPTRKVDPITGASVGSVIQPGTAVFFPEKFEVERKTFVRSQYDHINGNTVAIPLSKLENADIQYENFNLPRWMEAQSALNFYDVRNLQVTPRSLTKGSQLYFRYKFTVNGRMFVTDTLPSEANSYIGIDITNLNNVGDDAVPLLAPRQLEVSIDTRKINLDTMAEVDKVLEKGKKIFFSEKIYIEDKMYLITRFDSSRGISKAILFDNLREPQ